MLPWQVLSDPNLGASPPRHSPSSSDAKYRRRAKNLFDLDTVLDIIKNLLRTFDGDPGVSEWWAEAERPRRDEPGWMRKLCSFPENLDGGRKSGKDKREKVF